MDRRAATTAYFLNRSLGYLALIGRNVLLPRSRGAWVMVGNAFRAPWEVAEMVAATYPGIDVHRLPFIALLSDADVEEFETELSASDARAGGVGAASQAIDSH